MYSLYLGGSTTLVNGTEPGWGLLAEGTSAYSSHGNSRRKQAAVISPSHWFIDSCRSYGGVGTV